MANKRVNPADFLGARVLTPMEQDSVRGGIMRCSQQQQQQQQQQQSCPPQTPQPPQTPIAC